MAVNISKLLFDKLIDYSLSKLPFESCGMLTLKDSHIIDFYPVINISPYRHKFEMNKEEFEKVYRIYKHDSEKSIGLFHSHTEDFAVPSLADLDNFKSFNFSFLLIISHLYRDKPEVRLYFIKEKSLVSEDIRVKEVIQNY
ncbi:MAG: Mov34/MPN/PAD-1 family protein [Candidatus Hydrogenedentota bacterium]